MGTIAFIPVRGGSKSIPLKNIKPFCGKPLVCWSIEALESCSAVDKIIVATDNAEIEETVLAQSYKKQLSTIALLKMLVIQQVQRVSCLNIFTKQTLKRIASLC